MAFSIPDPDWHSPNPYFYMGWEFVDSTWRNSKDGTEGGTLQSLHRLHNPESPELIYSYKNYKPNSQHLGREYAAAWLIAHWFEHYMNMCDCLGRPHNRFRFGFIDTMML